MPKHEDVHLPEKPLEKTQEIDHEARISKEAKMKIKFNRRQECITPWDIQLSSLIFLEISRNMLPHIVQMIFQSLDRVFEHPAACFKRAIAGLKHAVTCLQFKHAATCFTGSIAYFKRATICLNPQPHDWNIIWSIIWNIFWITKKYAAAPLKHVVASLNIQLHISNMRPHLWNTKSHQNVLICHGNFLYPGMKLSKHKLCIKSESIFLIQNVIIKNNIK